jgi:hypothetical protein
MLLVAATLGGSVVLLACGQLRGTAPPALAAVPAGYAGQSGIPTALPPSLTRTPFPTYPAPIYTTPVPTEPNPPPKLTAVAGELVPTPRPTPRPNDPYYVISVGTGTPDVQRATKEATVVAIGTVRQILPARWTTPNGRRPANPHDPANPESISRPVLIEVEQYLKGQQPQRQLQLFAPGGAVGQDKVEVRLNGRAQFMFREGERVVVFLNERVYGSTKTLNGSPLWEPLSSHYTVGSDGLATDGFRTVPLQQLLGEIAEAQKQP